MLVIVLYVMLCIIHFCRVLHSNPNINNNLLLIIIMFTSGLRRYDPTVSYMGINGHVDIYAWIYAV